MDSSFDSEESGSSYSDSDLDVDYSDSDRESEQDAERIADITKQTEVRKSDQAEARAIENTKEDTRSNKRGSLPVNDEQHKILMAAYEIDEQIPQVRSTRMQTLCEVTGLTEVLVQRWFDRLRRRERYRSAVLSTEKGRKMDLKRKEWERQKEIFSAFFERDHRNPHIGTQRMNDIVKASGAHPLTIRQWFNNRRQIQKRRTGSLPTLLDAEENERRRPREHLIKREQTKILLAAFEKDGSVPAVDSDRVKELCDVTGLDEPHIRQWFSKTKNRTIEQAKELDTEKGRRTAARREEREKRREVLIQSYLADSSVPVIGSDRLEKLVVVTGMKPTAVKTWFSERKKQPNGLIGLPKGLAGQVKNSEILRRTRAEIVEREKWKTNKKIMLEFFVKDDTTPGKHSTRCNQLIEATGLHYKTIQKWFIRQRNTLREKENERIRKQENSIAIKKEDTKDKKQSIISQRTTLENRKKCAICDLTCGSGTTSIVSIKEAKHMDEYFKSSLTHFLTYTCAVSVCTEHSDEFRSPRNRVIK